MRKTITTYITYKYINHTVTSRAVNIIVKDHISDQASVIFAIMKVLIMLLFGLQMANFFVVTPVNGFGFGNVNNAKIDCKYLLYFRF